MNKKRFYRQVFVFLALVTIALAGFFSVNVNQSLTQSDSCTLHNKVCFFKQGDLDLSIRFTKTPQSEEELPIIYTLNSAWNIKQAWIEGVNMYMGKTPIIFDQDEPSQYSANSVISTSDELRSRSGVTFLGSCNLSHMQWRMNLILENEKTASSKELTVLFSTNQ